MAMRATQFHSGRKKKLAPEGPERAFRYGLLATKPFGIGSTNTSCVKTSPRVCLSLKIHNYEGEKARTVDKWFDIWRDPASVFIGKHPTDDSVEMTNDPERIHDIVLEKIEFHRDSIRRLNGSLLRVIGDGGNMALVKQLEQNLRSVATKIMLLKQIIGIERTNNAWLPTNITHMLQLPSNSPVSQSHAIFFLEPYMLTFVPLHDDWGKCIDATNYVFGYANSNKIHVSLRL